MKKIITSAEKAKKKRNDKILSLFSSARADYSRWRLYAMIAEEVGTSPSTVKRVVEDDREFANKS